MNITNFNPNEFNSLIPYLPSEKDLEDLNHKILICEVALGEIKVARELEYATTAKMWFQQQA